MATQTTEGANQAPRPYLAAAIYEQARATEILLGVPVLLIRQTVTLTPCGHETLAASKDRP